MPNENSPPISPSRKQQRLRPSLSGVFQPNFSLTEEMSRMRVASGATPPQSPLTTSPPTHLMIGSWATLRGWPNWGTIKAHSNQESIALNFTITMRHSIPDYSTRFDSSATAEAFRDAAQFILRNRDSIQAMATSGNTYVFDHGLAEEMTGVVFGSNQIERVGAGLDETIRLCREIFLEQRDVLESITPRSPQYQRMLEEIIRANGTDPKYTIRDRREVVNHAAAFVYITKAVVKNDEPFTEELIKETHRILCRDVPIESPAAGVAAVPSKQYAGVYRSVPVMAGSCGFVPPKYVPKKMHDFVEDLQSDLREAEETKTLDPFYLAAKHCGEFVNIHPFRDGNGRTCRLILNTILLKYAGIVAPIGEHDQERKEYLDIARRWSEDQCGPGELATYTLRKGVEALKKFGGSLRGGHD